MKMHYLTYVFIPKCTDIEGAVGEALRPFGDEFEVRPWKRHLDAGEIAAMAKCFGVRRTSLQKLAGCMEDWNGGRGGVDEKGLFAVLTYNLDGKWDWYEIGGRWNGMLPGNSMAAGSLLRSPSLSKRLPHDFLTPDGEWHQRSQFHRDGFVGGTWSHKSERRWLEEFRQALSGHLQHLVVSVDRHS
jgi:hypothetical protein